jgi:hypothetical protein
MTLGLTRGVRDVLSVDATPRTVVTALGHPSLGRDLAPSLSLSDLLAAAEHEAALRRHSHLDQQHVLLAAARLTHHDELAHRLSEELDRAPVRIDQWWRSRDRRQLDEQQAAAKAREAGNPPE